MVIPGRGTCLLAITLPAFIVTLEVGVLHGDWKMQCAMAKFSGRVEKRKGWDWRARRGKIYVTRVVTSLLQEVKVSSY